jgi:AcrR family transcriptional regulator
MAAPRDVRSAPRAAAEPPAARLAASQLRRMRRIVDAAVSLAEAGGFEAVRLRDVADRSEVALGTLYKYFRSKEDLLLFALSEEFARLEEAMVARPPLGRSPLARVVDFFRRATHGFTRKPHLARAVLRAMASGDPETGLKIAGAQLRVARLVVAALRGTPPDLEAPLDEAAGNARERSIALALQHVWFSSLVGWSAGLHDEPGVAEHVRTAARLMLDADG